MIDIQKLVDIAVIGAGPAGLSAAINAAVRGKTLRIFDTGDSHASAAERIENYPGMPGISGADIMTAFREHAAGLGISPEKARVSNILAFDGRFMLNAGLEGGAEIVEAATVIIAVGAARVKPISGEKELLGRGVSYCATCDGMLYRGKRAVVWGTAHDIVNEAAFLRDIGVNVTFVGERLPEQLADMPFVQGKLSTVSGSPSVSSAVTDEGVSIDTDAVFILRDSVAPDALLEGLEIENGSIKVDRFAQTNIPGVFAAGDCTGWPLQIANAVGGGLVAAQQAVRFLSK